VTKTFQPYAVDWLRRRVATGLRSANDYESMLRNHLLPKWTHHALTDIRPLEVRSWVESLQAKDLAPRTVRNIYGLLRNILADAMMDELIETNPCCLRGASLPPNEHKDPDFREKHVFSHEETLQIISQSDIPLRWRCLYMLQFATGNRIGETLALEWGDVQIDNGLPLIVVSKSYNSKTNKVGPTKTKIARKIPVHLRLLSVLRDWRAAYISEVQDPALTQYLVFPAPRGGAQKHMRSSVALHRFQKDLERMGLDKRRMHDARRTFVTLACNTDGADTEILRRVTHARKGDVHDGYREVPVEVVAREVRKLDLGGTSDE
jgi:integrase